MGRAQPPAPPSTHASRYMKRAGITSAAASKAVERESIDFLRVFNTEAAAIGDLATQTPSPSGNSPPIKRHSNRSTCDSRVTPSTFTR